MFIFGHEKTRHQMLLVTFPSFDDTEHSRSLVSRQEQNAKTTVIFYLELEVKYYEAKTIFLLILKQIRWIVCSLELHIHNRK